MNALLAGLIFMYSVEIGHLPHRDWFFYDYNNSESSFDVSHNLEYIDLNTAFELPLTIKTVETKFQIGGNIRTNISPNGIKDFNPTKEIYGFFVNYKIKNLEIGFRHNCQHPIYAYMIHPEKYSYRFEGSYEELYLKFSGSNKIFK
jgi:hypothetical protein